ncbi:hypothetical protein KM043_001792 [Ampulex compressa]|nr:hypothetical protein KM043_001792 [Ampulex compressa]
MEAPRIPAGTAPFVSSGLSRRQLDSLFGGGFGHGRRAASARRAGPRDGGRMRFGQTDRDSALERFAKRNIDEIDRTAFDSFFKRNLDEIDRVGWNGFGKRSDDYSPDRERF